VRQKKILQAFADDYEGRNPEIHFGPLPTPPSTSTTEPPEMKGKASPSPSPSSKPSQPQSPPPHVPFVETQTNPPPRSEAEAGEEGFIHTLASGLGKVIGWAERFMGSGSGSGGKR
jgi:molecular chaperone DnaJ